MSVERGQDPFPFKPTLTNMRSLGGHAPKFTSRRMNRSLFLPGHRRRYGWDVVCECGWCTTTDGSKAEIKQMHNIHLRRVIDAARGER